MTASHPTRAEEGLPDRRTRHEILPSLKDSDGLVLEWHPYFMRRAAANYRSPSLGTDALGFRHTIHEGTPLGYAEYGRSARRRGVLTGNSTSFGIGVSHDRDTVTSVLNVADPSAVWFNFSMRAFNLTQERIALDLYAPLDASYVVFFSGINNLVVALLGDGGSPRCCPFVGEPAFHKAMGRERPTSPGRELPPVPVIEARYRESMDTGRRDLKILGTLRRALGARLLFCLQPVLAWTGKVLTPEEKRLVEMWDEDRSLLHLIHKPEVIGPWRDRFVSDLHRACEDAGIDFLDLSADPVIAGTGWTFADRVHLADGGHRRVAAIVQEWVQS